jgi:ABC-type transport system substrate-binding protein
MTKNTSTINVAFPYRRSITEFDPQLVNTLAEATLARNLYSRIVNFSDDGQIIPGLAKEIQWENGEYKLEIRSDTFTIDEMPITSYDVYVSLLRIVIRNSNTHGSLRHLLCPSDKNPSLQSGCAGLRYDKSNVYLKPENEKHRFF